MSLLEKIQSVHLSQDDISGRHQLIKNQLLERAASIDGPVFTVIDTDDLSILFGLYDQHFFNGTVAEAIGNSLLTFRLSSRMTSAGGKTTCYKLGASRHYEISVSTALLFGCFTGDDHRPISCSGIVCVDRVDALMRIMEHELVHLIEMQLWNDSSCKKKRFHSITLRFFGHTENVHSMITPRERAIEKFGIQGGSKVAFQYEGQLLSGIVNRVTKRATVLVESADGQLYSDGNRYKKYYVPLSALRKVDS
ncbi:hypothetical protein AB833_03185 [Chromatiales bacterium (ex Bugula neritina AB1)]|nr:hypothetical protein AB833_03185 [Chromatiales bacterium (ex Bugula neritina AB1)]